MIVALREVTSHLRVPNSLAQAARQGAARRVRRRRVYVTAACATMLAVSGTALALQPWRPTDSTLPSVPNPSPNPSSTAPVKADGWPTKCELSRLPTPDNDPKSLVTGGDRTGRYL